MDTYQYASSGSLTGYQLTSPVLGLGHPPDLSARLLLEVFLLLLLDAFVTDKPAENSPNEHKQQDRQEGNQA